MAGKLTTHVLDITRGKPASGMQIELWTRATDPPKLLKTVRTNPDGRTAEPLLAGEDMKAGEYELVFDLGAYFQTHAFFNRVPIRFTIGDPASNYHVPLLCSPWAYSTYRGS